MSTLALSSESEAGAAAVLRREARSSFSSALSAMVASRSAAVSVSIAWSSSAGRSSASSYIGRSAKLEDCMGICEVYAHLNSVIDYLLAGCFAFNVFALVHVLEQLGGCSFGNAVLEVGADVCGAVGAVLLA